MDTKEVKETTSGKSKEISYRYWVSKPTSSEAKIACAPKKIDPTEAEKIASMCRQSSQGSSWNSAGTWEEKAVPAEAMKTHLQNYIDRAKPGNEHFKVTGVKDLSGDVLIFFAGFRVPAQL